MKKLIAGLIASGLFLSGTLATAKTLEDYDELVHLMNNMPYFLDASGEFIVEEEFRLSDRQYRRCRTVNRSYVLRYFNVHIIGAVVDNDDMDLDLAYRQFGQLMNARSYLFCQSTEHHTYYDDVATSIISKDRRNPYRIRFIFGYEN